MRPVKKQQFETKRSRNLNSQRRTDLHRSWQALMTLCEQLGHGEIERLKIQDGLPVSAETITRKVKLT